MRPCRKDRRAEADERGSSRAPGRGRGRTPASTGWDRRLLKRLSAAGMNPPRRSRPLRRAPGAGLRAPGAGLRAPKEIVEW